MARVAAGDAAALKLLSERHTPMLYAVAWRILGDATEAEDVVQETIVKLWVGASGWTPAGGGLGGWLRRVATNLCLDRKRKSKFIAGTDIPDRADDTPGADAMLDERRQAAAVGAAIQALPERQRAALVLTYYEGVSNAEAAAILGVHVKALESLLVRARQGMHRRLSAAGLLREGTAA